MTASSRDIQVKHVNHIVTMVQEPQRSLAFYCDLLGWVAPQRYCWRIVLGYPASLLCRGRF